jgi:hypothetical protein
MNRLVVALCLVPFLGFVGCDKVDMQNRVNGSGMAVSETRESSNVNKIVVEGDFTVIYKKAATNSIRITAQENLLPYIETTISGNTLSVVTKSGYLVVPTENTSIIVRVSSPQVGSLSLLGSGLVSADTLVGDAMTMDLNGSGSIAVGYAKGVSFTSTILGSGSQEIRGAFNELSCSLDGSGRYLLTGKTTDLIAKIKGSGLVDGYDLASQKSAVTINGSGICKLNVSSSLNVSINGSGNVMYKGNAVVSKSVTGSGTVQNVE